MLVSIKINISLFIIFKEKQRLHKLTCYMILIKNF